MHGSGPLPTRAGKGRAKKLTAAALWRRDGYRDCEDCRRTREELELGVADCLNCGWVEPSPANRAAWETFWAVADLLGDGWGGVRLANAEAAARALGHSWDDLLLRKINLLIRLLLKKEDFPEDADDRPGNH